jgi:hypothetical protein
LFPMLLKQMQSAPKVLGALKFYGGCKMRLSSIGDAMEHSLIG